MLHKAWNSKEEMPYCFPRSSIKFQDHTGQNITDFDPNWAFPDYRPVAAFKSLRFALFNHNSYLIEYAFCYDLNSYQNHKPILYMQQQLYYNCMYKITCGPFY